MGATAAMMMEFAGGEAAAGALGTEAAGAFGAGAAGDAFALGATDIGIGGASAGVGGASMTASDFLGGLGGGESFGAGAGFNDIGMSGIQDSGVFNETGFAGNSPGLASGGGVGGGGGSPWENLFKQFSSPKGMQNLTKTLGGAYGMLQSRKLQGQMALPNPKDIQGIPGYQAGQDAVMRSMSAQGYQGSGNMMAAMSKYGGDFYNNYANQRMQSAQAQSGAVGNGMSSLSPFMSGLSGLMGGN